MSRLIVFLICETLVPAHSDIDHESVLGQAADFVARSIQAAPWHIAIGIRLLSLVLLVWIYPAYMLARLRGLPPRLAARALDRVLERSPMPVRTAARVYRSLAVLAIYEHPQVLSSLGVESPFLRQQRFRSIR